ncbi:MAG: transglycosylase SLT domain-containing protein [Flavobacteriaceae bacterium]|nr:transglycosylase SLT domain-containing protein [Flavobacteriaceae bacterium]
MKKYYAAFFLGIFLGPLVAQESSIRISQEASLSQELPALALTDTISKPSLEALAFTVILDSILMASHVVPDPEISYSAQDSVTFFNPPKDSLKSRLTLLDQKTILDSRYNPSLERVIKMYLGSKRILIQKMLHRSAYYFPLFERELDALSMPMEIKYLAIVESALNPKARSRVGATGLWQFMYGTGKMMGLEVNNYIDERQDPLKSTQAAFKYLKKLHGMFGDWNLALAAYNSGPGNVRKAIRRAGGVKDFWAIRSFLPRETAGYVPALLTTMYLFEYAESHGFELPKTVAASYATDTIHLKKAISFTQLSKALSLSEQTIEQLNPVYKIGIIPQIEGKPQVLRLPIASTALFIDQQDSIYAAVAAEMAILKKPFPALQTVGAPLRYRVQSGDYLGKIAQRYGLRVLDIKKWNRLRNNNLSIGQRLTLYPKRFPVSGFGSASAGGQKNDQKSPQKSPSIAADQKTYTVAVGDSLWSIAQKVEGVSVADLKKWNDIWNNQLKPGTTIKLCSCTP